MQGDVEVNDVQGDHLVMLRMMMVCRVMLRRMMMMCTMMLVMMCRVQMLRRIMMMCRVLGGEKLSAFATMVR